MQSGRRRSCVSSSRPAAKARHSPPYWRWLDPKMLMLPDRLLDLIPPQAFNRPRGTAERFTGHTGLVFDPVAAAVTAADLVVSGLLNPQRAARLIASHARDPKAPGFDDVVALLVARTLYGDPVERREEGVARGRCSGSSSRA